MDRKKEEFAMSKTQPIRQRKQLEEFKDYYLSQQPNPRNYAMIILGLNTALRIGDILKITWDMVYDWGMGRYHSHLYLVEQKTGKEAVIALNHVVRETLEALRQVQRPGQGTDYLFGSQKKKGYPISRYQAYRIIKKAAVYAHLPEHVSCHSLRKTFGYHAWKNGTQPALIMDIFNHSSYQITKRYLCIEQDDKDDVFQRINL